MTSPVSYIESFAPNFNWSPTKLIQAASQLDPDFNASFATEMANRFHLPMDKKFNKLSLGMKTMVSTLISLASNKKVILPDEPVLGFDAIMRIDGASIKKTAVLKLCDFKTAVELLYFVLAHDNPAATTTVFLFPLGVLLNIQLLAYKRM